MSKQVKIPGIPHAFFKAYCKGDRYEELHGDLEEFFYERVEEKGLVKARLLYLRDVIKCFQPYAWKKPRAYSNSNIIMFKNYFKTSYRNAIRNPLSSFINVFGLSVAIGICIVVYAFMKGDSAIDRFHENKDKVFLTTFLADRNGGEEQYGMSPAPIGKMLLEDNAHIEKICRIKDRNVIVKKDDNVFYDRVRYVDPEFLEMFTFPLENGTASSLKDVSSIILSHESAIKYFGYEDPIGQDILILFNEGYKKSFKVTGVAKPFPTAHIIEFDFLINFENLRLSEPLFDPNGWDKFVAATLIQVDSPKNIAAIKDGMSKYKVLQNEVNSDWVISSFDFHSLSDLHFASANIVNGISYDGKAPGRIALPIIGALMLLLACFNYINMAIASATKRLKEIGVRKVIGADRAKVIVQFLTENVFLTSFALLLGFILARTVFYPWFSELSGAPLNLEFLDSNLWIFLISLLLFTGLVSGAYPALYISRFQAVKIFRGNAKFGKKNPLTKVFLGFQLVLACITITGAVVFTQNTAYQASRSWGYDQKQVVYANVSIGNSYKKMHSMIIQHPDVLSIAGATQHVGRAKSTVVVEFPERKVEVDRLKVSSNYFETMGVSIVEGRNFNTTPESDKKAIVVNETLVKRFGIDASLNQQLKIDSINYQIIGVVKDFHSYSFATSIKPTIFNVASNDQLRFLTLKVKDGSQIEVYDELKSKWNELYPEAPFLGGLQSDIWGGYFNMIDIYERFNKAIAGIAIVLAGLGLYGLISLNVSGRRKEFSVRKVLGARAPQLAKGLARQYALLAIIAFLIGAPLSYFAIKAQLGLVFVYAMPMNLSGVSISVIILILVLCAVITTQILRVSKSNPADGLRVE